MVHVGEHGKQPEEDGQYRREAKLRRVDVGTVRSTTPSSTMNMGRGAMIRGAARKERAYRRMVKRRQGDG